MVRGLDTRLWNLALAGIAAGCGPTVSAEPDGDSDSDGRKPCLIDGGCDEHMICVDDYCVPGERGTEAGGSAESGCSHYEYCYEYECDGDDDCEAGEVCTRAYYEWPECEALPVIGECEGDLRLIQMPIELLGDDDVEHLRFVHADGDGLADLAIMRSSSVEVVFAQGERAAIERASVVDVAAGDFDRDGLRDLVLANDEDNGTLSVWTLGADGEFEPSFGDAAGTYPRRIAAVTWTDDGAVEDDLAVLSGLGSLRVLEGPSFAGGSTLVDEADVGDFAVADFDGDGLDDFVYTTPRTVWLSTGTAVIEDVRDRNGVLAGRFDGSSIGVVTHTLMPNAWMLLEGDGGVRALLRPEDNADSGDVDGDGTDDVVLVGDLGLTLVMGGEAGPLMCHWHEPAFRGRALSTGDIDGDGQAEVAVSDGATVTLLRL